ncbi:MAG: Y-family DNA polymerase, partial [Kiritimatiellae bacterium]|nr:Y-family DNA polymerase [Kiritimatiellia bacterium]
MIGLVDGNNFFVSCERVFNRRLVGRPVAVLSNNDGCCVARSNEFKALGISMGTPYFQLKHREKTGELSFCSSNYELYGDMSNRIISILREEAVDVEQYSIDEAFIYPPTTAAADYIAYGKRIRAKVLRWVGIPCGVGFAPTKTLAKISNHIAKKQPDGVFRLPDDPTEILSKLPCDEVWGVGRRLAPKLRAERILTAQHLRDAHDDTLRAIGGVTLLRVAMELRGISCHEERDYDADPDSISCSRSFGEPATTQEALAESLASFTAQAAAKLRRHGLLAAGCNIYAQIFAEGGGGDCVGRTVVFPSPTDATNVILRGISDEVKYLYLPGVRYRKTGIVFFGLERPGTAHQM